MKNLLCNTVNILFMRILPTIFVLCVSSAMLAASPAAAQNIADVKISVNLVDASLLEAFGTIERKTDFKFLYKQEVKTNTRKISVKASNKSVRQILTAIAKQTGISFKQVNNTIAVQQANRTKPDRSPTPAGSNQAPTTLNRTITGKVTDENATPLIGATVQVKGQRQIGTITDAEGRFVIRIPNSATSLIFSYLGFLPLEVDVTSRSVVDVVLEPDLKALEGVEVVSTGYYEVEQRLNPGNVAKVDAKVIGQQPVVNPLEALQGRMTGVQIQQTTGVPGGEVNINIRGVNSLNNGQVLNDDDRTRLPNANLPFFVINGVPYTNTSVNSEFFAFLGNGNPLTFLQLSDIESIEVLKDADATAIYGSRGANGVVLITTKKGKAGKTRVDLNYSRGWGELSRRAETLSTDQFLEIRRETLFNDGIEPDSAIHPQLTVWDQSRQTDWQEVLLGGVADQTNFGARVSGGNVNTSFSFGANYFSQGNVYNFDDSRFRRLSGQFNINHTSSNKRLVINASSNYTYTVNNQNGADFTFDALGLEPNAPVLFNEDGSLNWENSTWENPLAALNNEFRNISRNLVLSTTISYEIADGLKISSRFGYTYLDTDESNLTKLSSFDPAEVAAGETGAASFSDGSSETWIIEPQLDYSKEISRGKLSVLLGTTFQSDTRERQLVAGFGYTNDALIEDIFAAQQINIRATEFSEYNYTAVFGRLNYVWEDKYLINLTGRRDGSSRFGPGRQFGNFGAVGVAWIFSEEQFVKSALSFLSFGKLRGSYGSVGSDQIGNYQYLTSYRPVVAYDGNESLVPSRAANLDYGWETTAKLEFGLELGVIDNRIQVNTSWYSNRTTDQLIGKPLPGTTGFSSTQFNLPAIVQNKGWEFEVSTTNVVAGGFRWMTSFNMSIPENELLEFPDIAAFSVFDATYEVGQPILGRKQYGLVGVNPETGAYDFVDFNRDGAISVLDRQFFVPEVQDFFGGLSNTFSYKGFQLAVFIDFVKQDAPLAGIELQTARWQNPGDITNIQKLGSEFNLQRRRSGGVLREDASYIRLRNVSLSWQLPNIWIAKARLQNARLYVQGQNLATITSYNGWDPETGAITLPPLQMITTGVQLSF